MLRFCQNQEVTFGNTCCKTCAGKYEITVIYLCNQILFKAYKSSCVDKFVYCPQNKDSCSQGIYADGSKVIDSCPLTCKTCTSKLIKNGGTSKINYCFSY